MSSNLRTAEQAKAEHILRMGKDLGTVYDALWQEVAWIYTKWTEFVTLFGTKESRVELLNEVAPSFFRLLQDSLWENVLLHIARLTDQPVIGKKHNLTVQQLPIFIEHQETRAKVEQLIQNALSGSTFARDWRNRHIAHSDLDLSVSDTAKPLELASHEKVNVALQALSDVLNAVSSHYLQSTSFFDKPCGEALSLLHVLDEGRTAHKLRLERLRRGETRADDWQHRDI